MKEDEFKVWLESKGQNQRSIGSRISNIKVLERVWGDVDNFLNDRGAAALLEQLKYSTEDKRHNRPNPSPVAFKEGADIYNGLSTLRSALTLYVNFRSAVDGAGKYHLSDEVRALHVSLLSKLTAAEIELAMQECDELGEQEFLKKRNFSSSAATNRVRSKDGSTLYPAKAIVCAAIGYLPEGVELDSSSFFNGHGGAQARDTLEELGFEIVPGERGDSREITRSAVETAMDAYDQYRATGDHSEIFDAFGDPRDYWVRSTRERENRVYPTKPLIGFILNKTKLNGGWGEQSDAAARLHNAGFIIVDQNDQPTERPERYEHLMEGADRIRLCALNYFIEPAREKAAREVSIRAGDIAAAMGLKDAFPNICQALGGEKFQNLAQVPPPTSTEPNPSSSTVFTYTLNSQPEADIVTGTNTTTSPSAVNLILYGPPGTGKTYQTAREAVRLSGEPVPQDRGELLAVYEKLAAAGRIEFVTFHQSMSYEDFVEGRQPMTGEDGDGEADSAGFRLETVHGVFRRIAKRAETSRGRSSGEGNVRLEGRQVFKMSIGEANNPEASHLFEESIEGGYTLLGFDDIDWGDEKYASREAIFEACKDHRDGGGDIDVRSGFVQMPFRFRNWVQRGDIVIVSKGNQQFRAIGEFVGDYEFQPRPEGGYAHRRAVQWLWVDREGVAVSEIYSRRFIQQSIYLLDDSELNTPSLERYMNSQSSDGSGEPDQFVLIIDEINRANISKVFGELITLLEADKRLKQPNAVRVRLPYSGDEFGVPSNLHILGTMNTADRSIALLDTALRRRFTFREMMPNASILRDAAKKCGINLPQLLSTINERIEYLYDREHQIGHAYFTACSSRADVDEVMRDKVIPLLAEYFFEDWAKIAAVLGDLEPGESSFSGGFLKRTILNPPPGLEDGDAVARFRWQVRSVDEGFDYSKLVGT